MYSASVLDMMMLLCFFDQLTNLSPNSCILPDVLFMVSWQPAWSASTKDVRAMQESFEYHRPIFMVPLRIVDSIDLNGATRNTTRSISTWDDLTTRFLTQFFPPGRTVKHRKDVLMFQQHQDESLCDAWTRFNNLLQKVPHRGLYLWLQVQIFYDHVDYTTQMVIDYAAGGRLRKLRPKEAWKTIEDLA
uniref:Zinc finger, CCHC-type n=1 Tax=Tanacetum cinerariifolium TaxID=118510 RepID=A0A6L2P464_TANCI|nr:zinc finger, CCHC-type [Tanacetum cinerariifolium]